MRIIFLGGYASQINFNSKMFINIACQLVCIFDRKHRSGLSTSYLLLQPFRQISSAPTECPKVPISAQGMAKICPTTVQCLTNHCPTSVQRLPNIYQKFVHSPQCLPNVPDVIPTMLFGVKSHISSDIY